MCPSPIGNSSGMTIGYEASPRWSREGFAATHENVCMLGGREPHHSGVVSWKGLIPHRAESRQTAVGWGCRQCAPL